jgi:hypothetical protein
MTVDSGPKKREASGVEFSSSKKPKITAEANTNNTQSNDVEANGGGETLQNQQETPASSHLNKSISCTICGLTFAELARSIGHFLRIHRNDFLKEKINIDTNDPTCPFCDKKETSIELAISHMTDYHGIDYESDARWEVIRSISFSAESPEFKKYERLTLKSLTKYSCFRCSKKYSNQVTDHLCCKSF